MVALEGPAERLLGVVAHPAADRGHAEVGAPQQPRLGGFPCAGLRQVRTVIDPVTAEG